MINRREFIKRLGALGAAAIVSPKVLIDEGVGYEVEPEKDPRIIGTLGGVPIIETDLSEEVACFMPLGGLEW
ncbi:MAG: twin-arginine translocation signal domain-containing protein, partial [Planctomycetes bacterium]|nr:twin-arginine translocation signal domain-containing protein [Planctomycetota bacterium]